jgi:hypothetical protein
MIYYIENSENWYIKESLDDSTTAFFEFKENKIIVLLNGSINFHKQFIPSKMKIF